MRFLKFFLGIALIAYLLIPLDAMAAKANAIARDGRYSRLYNICYGHSSDLRVLKEKYHRVYGCLGKEAGGVLAIERVSARDYALIYRLRASQDKAASLMARHKRLLGSNKIQVTLTADNNNPVVYAESSPLHNHEHRITATGPNKQKSATRKSGISNSPATRLGLQKDIGELVSDLYRQGQLDRGERCAWMLYDVEKKQPLASINGNQLFQAASMIKPFLALAFFHQVEAGKLQYGEKARQMVERMIQHSSNEAANWVMRRAGGPANCERILRRNYGGIFRKTQIVEYIPAGGKTYRNKVIPSDYARFLLALWDMKLPYSKELQRVMALPKRSRIYQGTTLPQGTLVYNKTGSTARLCGDMGILVPPPDSGVPTYALVGVIERGHDAGDYTSWIRRRGDVIRQVSSLVYKEIRAKR
jgi:beta-lactamase class A